MEKENSYMLINQVIKEILKTATNVEKENIVKPMNKHIKDTVKDNKANCKGKYRYANGSIY
jgi:hypothetical protein